MPSPFPGMDPFLEHPRVFPGLHGSLITYLKEALQPRLPEPYFAETGERVWVELSRSFIEPDVQVRRQNGEPLASTDAGGSGLAVAVMSQPVVVTVPHDERRETLVEIYMNKERASAW